MADNNENIIIQIDANTSRFQEKLNQVINKMKAVGKTAEDLKNALSNVSGNYQGLGNTVQGLQNGGEALSRYIQRIDDATKNSSNAIKAQVANLKLQNIEYNLQQHSLERMYTALGQTEERMRSMVGQYGQQREAMEQTKTTLEELIKKYNRLQSEIGSKNISAKAVKDLEKDAQKAQVALQLQENAIAYAQAQLAVPANDRIKKAWTGGRSYADALKKDAEDTAKLRAEIENLQADIPKLKNEYEQAVQAMEAGKALLNKQHEAEALRAEIERLFNTFREQSTAIDAAERSLNGLGDRYKQSSEEAAELAGQLSGMQNKISLDAGITESNAKLEKFANVLGTILDVVGRIGAALTYLSIKGLQPLVKGFATLGKNAMQAWFGIDRLRSISQRLSNAFHQVGRQASRMLTRMAFRAIFKNIGNAMKALALQFESFNEAMSSMGAGANQLTAQIVAAFSPLIEAVAPIVNKLISMVVDLMNAISQLFAILGGQSTWRRAIKGVYDYSGALNAAGGSAGKAKDETEDYKRTILGFDEINKLNAPYDNSSSSGGGGGSGSNDELVSTFQYVEEELSHNSLTEWADRLYSAFTSHDWKELGATVADGVNSAFSWLDNLVKWENSGTKITGIVTAVTDAFNSFLTTTNWELIGTTIGDSIDTLLNTIISFQNRIDFSALGQAIANGLNGLMDNVELSDLATAITNSINNAFTTLGNFNDTFNWDTFSENLSNGLNAFFQNFEWTKNAEALSSFVINMVSSLGQAVKDTDWEEFGRDIADALLEINWGELLASVVTLIWNVITGAFKAAFGFFDELDTSEAVRKINETSDAVRESVGKLNEDLSTMTSGFDTQQSALSDMITLIDDLSKSGDTTQAQAAIDELLDKWPFMSQWINDTRDGFNQDADAVMRFAQATLLASQIEELVQKRPEAVTGVQDAKRNYEAAIRERKKVEAQYGDQNQVQKDAFAAYLNVLNAGGSPQQAVQAQQDYVIQAEKALARAKEAETDAYNAWVAAGRTVENYDKEIIELSNEINGYTQTQEKGNKVTNIVTKTQQKLNTIMQKVNETQEESGAEAEKSEKKHNSLIEAYENGVQKVTIYTNSLIGNNETQQKSQTETEKSTQKQSKLASVLGEARNKINLVKEATNAMSTSTSDSATVVSNATGTINNSFTGMGNHIQMRVTPIIKQIPIDTGNALDDTNTEIVDATPTVSSSSHTLGDKVKTAFQNALTLAGATGTELSNTNKTISNSGTALSNAGKTVSEKITALYASGLMLGEKTNQETKNTQSTITASGTGISGAAKTIATGASNAYGNSMTLQKQTVSELDAAIRAIKDKASSFGSAGSSIGKSFLKSFSEAAGSGADGVGSGIGGVLGKLDFSGYGKKAGKSFADAFEKAAKDVSIEYKVKDTGNTSSISLMGKTIKQPIYAVQAYANGGFPDMGQYFLAGEDGPEMVGVVNNRNAVVNNKQIVSAVSAGVSEAVGNVMSQVFMQAQNQGSGDMVIMIDSEELYRATLKGQQKYTKRTSPVLMAF